MSNPNTKLSPAQRRFLDRLEQHGYYSLQEHGVRPLTATAVAAWHRTARSLAKLGIVDYQQITEVAHLRSPVWFAAGWGCEAIGPVSIETWRELANTYEVEGSNPDRFLQFDSAEEVADYNRKNNL